MWFYALMYPHDKRRRDLEDLGNQVNDILPCSAHVLGHVYVVEHRVLGMISVCSRFHKTSWVNGLKWQYSTNNVHRYYYNKIPPSMEEGR